MRPASPSAEDLLALARRVFHIEADALRLVSQRLDHDFARAVAVILACTGRVVVSGMGKSGHVGGKIAATLASTGTPAFFMHPGEASHGDLGMIAHDDVVLALSNSGESGEIVSIVPLIKRRGAKLVAMTGNPASTLAKAADAHLNTGVEKEACPLNLAPTASTTASLAMGDALAVALLDARGFSADDFARTHPGGSLGRRLLVHVRDVMHSGDALPRVDTGASLKAALFEMTQKGLGMTAIVDAAGRVAGLFTDGDLRRVLERPLDIQQARIADLMTKNPKTIRADELAVAAVEKMDTLKINGLLVVDDAGALVGALNMHDLLKAGVV
ncbi:MAG TPA: KpsF/GutQ family sugar-phosphate isomerase [Thiobacillus sp.]|nr:MAG: D-arabinose 5-phosphate isomerase [Hydrogenophilales bacterium 12-64-13]OYZ06389.1 MAG: D-arabinose 5-phosphate isomerase [Hydrogenophilales bacterium 16-64-46]OZA39058.1 MAG: D-arabinose 5-phosphate isomerase [Hydrogenophilales bacterium 17-64-34]HQS82729.1 KpsF/GutQ family sugar-phosphate isomerase [Thiobacillus sp.]HQT01274.1 KpsF/GutQ family sugar-phosphate isomerase [Thiobacillus sp.]